jgi:aminocarboxymuconate-semialdehyde decarboxylase
MPAASRPADAARTARPAAGKATATAGGPAPTTLSDTQLSWQESESAAPYSSVMKASAGAQTVVDPHNHVVPERFLARLREAGNPFGVVRVEEDRLLFADGGTHPIYREMWDPEAKLAALDAHGIDVAGVSPVPPLLGCHLPAEAAADFCREMNAGIAELVAAAPRRLLPIVSAPLQDVDLALAELDRVDARGIEVAAWSAGRPLGDPALRPFWRRVEERRLLVFVHPFTVQPQVGMGRYYMSNLVGNPVETTIAMADVILSGLLDDCPGLRFLMSHGGGFGPYQVGRWRHGYQMRRDVSSAARRLPTDYLECFLFDTITHDDQALSFLIRRAGADHVVLGSDFPYDMADPDPVATVDRQALTAAERAAIVGGTALRLLGGA